MSASQDRYKCSSWVKNNKKVLFLDFIPIVKKVVYMITYILKKKNLDFRVCFTLFFLCFKMKDI